MADAIHRSEPPEQEVVRTRRVEVIDASGRVRIVMGDRPGSGTHGLSVFGIALLGPDGSVRADLLDDAAGAALSFVSSGNQALEVGVDDANTLAVDRGGDRLIYLPAGDEDNEVMQAGPYLRFSDPDGRMLLEWRANWEREADRHRPRREATSPE
jgi:hypothetical protein